MEVELEKNLELPNPLHISTIATHSMSESLIESLREPKRLWGRRLEIHDFAMETFLLFNS